MNQINKIEIYRYLQAWVFDDEEKGLDKEPFVAGIPEILDTILSPAFSRAVIVFSKDPFPSELTFRTLNLIRKEHRGAWYEYHSLEGWLCPALYKFFDDPPKTIHFTIEGV